MALPRNSRRTTSIVTTVVSGAGRAHASDAIRRPPDGEYSAPPGWVSPAPPCWLRGGVAVVGGARGSACPHRRSLASRRARHMLSRTTEAGQWSSIVRNRGGRHDPHAIELLR